MYKVMFKDNWDKYSDSWHSLTEADFDMNDAEAFIALCKMEDKYNNEENRWTYTITEEN